MMSAKNHIASTAHYPKMSTPRPGSGSNYHLHNRRSASAGRLAPARPLFSIEGKCLDRVDEALQRPTAGRVETHVLCPSGSADRGGHGYSARHPQACQSGRNIYGRTVEIATPCQDWAERKPPARGDLRVLVDVAQGQSNEGTRRRRVGDKHDCITYEFDDLAARGN